MTQRASGLVRCWSVGDDNLTGALHILDLWLSPTRPSSVLQENPEWWYQDATILTWAYQVCTGKWPLSDCMFLNIIFMKCQHHSFHYRYYLLYNAVPLFLLNIFNHPRQWSNYSINYEGY